jgi:hypothetical protein
VRRVYGRIVKAQILWAIGAALALASPVLSIAFLFVIQLVYAIGPRLPGIEKITG